MPGGPSALPPPRLFTVVYEVGADKPAYNQKLTTPGRPRHYGARLEKSRFDKLFSQQEANELVPRLELLMRDLQVNANELRRQVTDLAHSDSELDGMGLQDIIDRHPELKELTSRMAELAGQIESFGCFLKDIEQGLVDFPGEVDGELVFLCWQFGEPRVLAWHGLESGFSSRQPLKGTPKPYLN